LAPDQVVWDGPSVAADKASVPAVVRENGARMGCVALSNYRQISYRTLTETTRPSTGRPKKLGSEIGVRLELHRSVSASNPGDCNSNLTPISSDEHRLGPPVTVESPLVPRVGLIGTPFRSFRPSRGLLAQAGVPEASSRGIGEPDPGNKPPVDARNSFQWAAYARHSAVAPALRLGARRGSEPTLLA
jgi:hypothetical protein